MCPLLVVGCGFDSQGAGKPSSTIAADTGSTDTSPMETTAAATTMLPDGGPTSSATSGDHEASTGPGATTSTSEDTTSGADTGQQPLPLDDDGVIVRYYLDETHMGQNIMWAEDATDDPYDLDHDWHAGLVYHDDGNRGLRWGSAGQDGGPARPVRDSKIEDELEGATEATIEIVADIQSTVSFSRIVSIERGSSDVRLGLLTPSSEVFELRWHDNDQMAAWQLPLPTGRRVFHVVLETTADEDDRVRLYIDGTRQNATKLSDWPEAGDEIDFHNDSQLVLGNRVPGQGGRSFGGMLYYAALYSTAFGDNRIAHHVAVLSASDDAP